MRSTDPSSTARVKDVLKDSSGVVRSQSGTHANLKNPRQSTAALVTALSRSDCPNRAAGTVQGRFEVGDSCGPALPDVGTVSFYHADKMPLSPLFGPVGR